MMHNVHPNGHPPPHQLDPTSFSKYVFIRQVFPAPAEPRLPAHIPQRVADILLEAEANLAKKGKGVHTAAMAYGKALDVAFKNVDPAMKGTLHERITKLGASGKITPELAEWAGDLRLIRNDSMHEEEPPSLEDVAQIAEATQLMLQYLFTLPGMLEKYKAEQAKPAPDGATSAA